MKRWGIAAVALSLSAPSAWAGDVSLVKDGKPNAVIYVSADLMKPDTADALHTLPFPQRRAEEERRRLRESVNDLALYLEKMSGAKVPISTDAPPANSKEHARVLIDDLGEAAVGKAKKSAPYQQGFRVVVDDKDEGTLSLVGESDLATSYAIYEILDTQLGCRWFMPGDMGEVIPQSKTVKLPEMDKSLAPYTIFRTIWYADDNYKRRNRMGGLALQTGHALENSWITKEDREKHPEWRATVNGKPSEHRLKWSNKELGLYIADKILAQHAKSPEPSYSLSPDDGMGYDNSPEDKALDAGDFDPTIGEVSLTDRLIHFVNPIAEKVTQKHPDVLLGMLAYANYTRPPLREKLHPNIVPQIAPITYSRAHPMNRMEVPGNKDLNYIVDGWAKQSKMTSYYFYGWFLAEPVAPNPMLAKWGHDVPHVLKNGKCMFWQPETMPNFETSMHALYLGVRQAWDPSLKSEDIFNDIDTKFYGSAAKPMTAYWRYIDDCWTGIDDYTGCGFGYMRRWTPDKMAKARELMNAALAAAKTDAEKYRINLANESLKLFEDFMKLRRDQAEGRWAGIGKDADAWKQKVKDLGEKYKDNATFTRTHYAPQTVDGMYFNAFYDATYQDAARVANGFNVLTAPPLREWKWMKDDAKDPAKGGESLGYAKAEFDDSQWKTTDVCVETWSTLGLHDYFENVWYRKEVSLGAVPAGKKVYLWIGSTDGSAKVFVNGQHVKYLAQTKDKDGKVTGTETKDEIDGYCQPFSFDITSAIKPGQTNEVSIRMDRTFLNELGTGGLLAPAVIYAEK
jgi:hypothetical protein